ncbi:hypothetical protein LJC33_01860 [Eubacteriales bacterium OttesenSCG-928-N13]|nr:hypothetical protein [Eubacteriales bacterium OttesenSCG-928-N13]
MKQLEYEMNQVELPPDESPVALDLGRAEQSRAEAFERAEGAELPHLRTEHSKQFDLGESRYQAVIYPEPVHYRKAGRWEEIDNNVEELEAGGRRVLRNRANALLCELSLDASEGDLIQLTHKNHALGWSFEDQVRAARPQVLSGEVLKREQLLLQARAPGSAAAPYTDEELRASESPEARRGSMLEKTSEVRYLDLLPGLDVHYTLSGDQIKEDIICASREALNRVRLKLPLSYEYIVHADQSMGVLDRRTRQQRFLFDMPVVYDAAGMTVIAKVTLSPGEGYIRLSYEIDDDFLSACVYPVTIDPVVKPRATKGNMECAVLSSSGAVSKNPASLKLERSASKRIVTLMRLTKLAAIRSSDTVISAKLKLTLGNASKAKGKHIGLYNVEQDWTMANATASQFVNASKELIHVSPMQDYAVCKNSTVSLDLTNMYRDWYRVEEVGGEKKSLNRGFLLSMESSVGVANIGSPKSGKSRQPRFIVNYISHAGIEDWWTYESQSAGRAGTANVDLFNGNVVHAHPDTQMSGSRMPASITHYYNSCQSASNTGEEDTTTEDSIPYLARYRCGYGWKHSGLMHVYETKVESTPYFVWVDGDGTEHWFKRKKDKREREKKEVLSDVEGMGLKLTKVEKKGAISEKVEIEDRGHSVMTFRRRLTAKRKGTWKHWWLTSVRDSMRNSEGKLTNIVRYTYKMPDPKDQDENKYMRMFEGMLTRIEDPAGRRTEFSYYDESDFAAAAPVRPVGLLKSIRTPTGSGGGASSVLFGYDARQRLTGILYQDLLQQQPPAGASVPQDSALIWQLMYGDHPFAHTQYRYAGDTNLLQSAMNYEGTTVTLGYEQLDERIDLFDVPDGEELDEDAEPGDEQEEASPSEPEVEFTVKMSENMLRAICMETIKRDPSSGMALARGAKQMFTYKSCLTEVTHVEDASEGATSGKKIIYQFNDRGNAISVRDELGYAQFVKFDEAQENTPIAASFAQRAVINRILAPSLMKDNKGIDALAWQQVVENKQTAKAPGNLCTFDNKQNRCLSCASMKLVRKLDGALRYSQRVKLEPGEDWTLSAYVKVKDVLRRPLQVDNEGEAQAFVPGDGAYMRVYPVGMTPADGVRGEGISGSTEDAFEDGMAADGWERMRLSFKSPASAQPVDMMVEFVLDGESGTAYFAAPQLERGLVANPVNLLSNGDFFLTETEKAVKPSLPGHVSRQFPQYWAAGKGVQKEILNKAKTKVTTKADRLIGVFNPALRTGDPADPEYNRYDLPGNRYDPFLPVLSGNYLQQWTGRQSKSKDSWFSQTLAVTGKEKDVFYAGGWASAMAMPKSTGDVRSFRLMIQFQCKDKNGNDKWYTGKGGKHHFNSEWVGWQMQAGAAVAPKDYMKVRVLLVFRGQPLFGKFTNMFLYREEFGSSYQYDGQKNVVSATERSGQQSGMEYDTYGNLIGYRKPGRAKKAENKYKLKYGVSEREKKQHLLRETKTPMGLTSATKYDKYGNALESVGKASGTKLFIKAQSAYSAQVKRAGQTVSLNTNGNYPVMKTDALGHVAYSNIQPQNGLLLWAQDPNETRVQYEYDHLKRLTQVVCQPNSDLTYGNRYIYNDKGQMTHVSHNTSSDASGDVCYEFLYDALGALAEVKLGSRRLSQNIYNQADRSHRLEESVFGNGGRLRKAYDEFDRVIGISFDEADPYTDPRYVYQYGANGQVAYVTDKHLGRTHWTEYDQAGRPMQATTWDGVFDAADPEARGKLLYRTSLKYDKYNHLTMFGERVPGKDKPKKVARKDSKGKVIKDGSGKTVYDYISDDDGTDNITTKYQYDRDDRVTKIAYDEKDEERSVSYTYDKLGRISKAIVMNGGELTPIDPDEQTETDTETYTGKLSTTTYTYEQGGHGSNSTTGRITQITHDAGRLDYSYDVVGNIVSETNDLHGSVNGYQYDKLGQLTRVDAPNDKTGGTAGTTWVYQYDLGGNILTKKAYQYTPTRTPIEPPTKVFDYIYDTEWRDLLKSYDGMEITYDQIGNPLNCDGWTYTWVAGRKLEQMEHADGRKLEFSYDASGLRTQKKYSYLDQEGKAVIETTDYILHGKLLTHQKFTKTVSGEQEGEPYELHFYYDKSSRPIMVREGSEQETAKYYTYVHSLQGDILGIIDREQQVIVEYTYDACGRKLSASHRGSTVTSLEAAQKLAQLNPFRYRGYQYDEETALYYLRSRYYNPTWGRFINEDVLIGKTGKLLSHNMFAYCRNNPVVKIDADGMADSNSIGIKSARDYALNWIRMMRQNYGAARPFKYIPPGLEKNPTGINCYAYAVMAPINLQPGDIGGRKPNAINDVYDVAKSVKKDLETAGVPVRQLNGPTDDINLLEYRIALRVGTKLIEYPGYEPFYDYHFMVQTNMGTWAEKHGAGGDTVLHGEGENPDTIAWTLSGPEQYYDSDIVYFALTLPLGRELEW